MYEVREKKRSIVRYTYTMRSYRLSIITKLVYCQETGRYLMWITYQLLIG